MHSDETAFNDVAGHEGEDATDIESVVSEKSGACVEKECRPVLAVKLHLLKIRSLLSVPEKSAEVMLTVKRSQQ